MIPVIFAPQADEELEDIGDYIAKDSPVAALRVVAELRERARKIGHTPRAYPRREDLAPGLRALSWRSYVVLFQITSSCVEVLHFAHGARDLKRLFED